MNQQQLTRMEHDKGFVAALDQSGGSTPKALKAYGIDESAYHGEEEMFTCVHEMRTRIIKSPAFDKSKILAAILFENTMDRKIDGLYTADYLWEKKGIIPILKVDKGLAPEADGVQLMKPIPDLSTLLDRANARHIFGTKMRSVIKEANPDGIRAIIDQQFAFGKEIIAKGLVPILEPEVDIHCPDKAMAEEIMCGVIKENLAKRPADAKLMFKFTIPSVDNLYAEIMKNPHATTVSSPASPAPSRRICASRRATMNSTPSSRRQSTASIRHPSPDDSLTEPSFPLYSHEQSPVAALRRGICLCICTFQGDIHVRHQKISCVPPHL